MLIRCHSLCRIIQMPSLLVIKMDEELILFAQREWDQLLHQLKQVVGSTCIWNIQRGNNLQWPLLSFRSNERQGYKPWNSSFPSECVIKGPQLIHTVLWDYISPKTYLLQEIAGLKSEATPAVDHQLQTCKSIQWIKGELNIQSFAVVGDGGEIILSYIVVSSKDEKCPDHCMKYYVVLHGSNFPVVCYIDCTCCNGVLGGHTNNDMTWRGS
jgi:hypothetical protein